MEEIKKLLELSKQIEAIYYDLMNIEYIGLIGNQKFEEKIEFLKLYKEVEENYINIIKKKYKTEEILGFMRSINTDNIVKKDSGNFTFISEYLVNEGIKKEDIIKRRVYNMLSEIVISNFSDDDLSSMLDEDEFYTDYKIYVNGRYVYVFDRVRTLYQMICSVEDNIDLKYLLFIQLNINSNIYKDCFLTDKYYLIFITKSLEDVMIEHNFYLDEIESIKHVENHPLNQEVFDYLLENECNNLFMEVIDRNLHIENDKLKDENVDNILLLLIDDALIRSSSLEISDELKFNKQKELKNENDRSTIIVRKHLIQTIESTKKDKIYLKL